MTPPVVLIVEDDAMLGQLLAEVVTGLGYAVMPVEATEEGAVAAANRRRPDLMIIDAWLGGGSGVVAARRINAAGPVPHLFITADARGRHAFGPGDVVLDKPFSAEELREALLRLRPPSPMGGAP